MILTIVKNCDIRIEQYMDKYITKEDRVVMDIVIKIPKMCSEIILIQSIVNLWVNSGGSNTCFDPDKLNSLFDEFYFYLQRGWPIGSRNLDCAGLSDLENLVKTYKKINSSTFSSIEILKRTWAKNENVEEIQFRLP